jgi:hypothetical protein
VYKRKGHHYTNYQISRCPDQAMENNLSHGNALSSHSLYPRSPKTRDKNHQSMPILYSGLENLKVNFEKVLGVLSSALWSTHDPCDENHIYLLHAPVFAMAPLFQVSYGLVTPKTPAPTHTPTPNYAPQSVNPKTLNGSFLDPPHGRRVLGRQPR